MATTKKDEQTNTDQPAEDQQEAEQAAEQANEQVQEAVDQETEQGFRGIETDQTPNEAYTVAGVTRGDPVPETETDPVAARREAAAS